MIYKAIALVGALAVAAAAAIGVNFRDDEAETIVDDSSFVVAQASPALAPRRGPPSTGPKAAFPNTDDGLPLMQVNPSWGNTTVDAFVNHARGKGFTSWRADDYGAEPMSFPEMMEAGLIDPVTMLPQAVPEGHKWLTFGQYRNGAREYPAWYAGTWVIEWDGDADARCGGGGYREKTRVIGKTRIECDFAADDHIMANVEFTRIGSLKDIAIFRAEDEALYRSGQVFHPRFIDHLAGYKIIRTLDVTAGSGSCKRSVSSLINIKSKMWGTNEGCTTDDSLPGGAPLILNFDMAVASDTALWLNISGMIGAGEEFSGETLPTGRGAGEEIEKLVRDAGRSITESPEWRAYADAVVEALIASGYPDDRMLYLELANEVWNFGNSSFARTTYYYWGMGDVLKAQGLPVSGERFRWALGYMTAQFATYVEDALKQAGRTQPVTYVLAGQMAGVSRTEAALKGYRGYFDAAGVDAAPWLARAGVSAASYFYEGKAFDKSLGLFPAATDAARDALWLAAIADDPAGTATALTDRIVNGGPDLQGTLAWIVAMRAQHQALAERYGAFFLGDYEGHDHGGGLSSQKKNPVFVNWLENWRAGPEGATLTRAWVEALRGQNPEAAISNFHTIGIRDPQGDAPDDATLEFPWVDGFWSETTAREKAFGEYLRPIKEL